MTCRDCLAGGAFVGGLATALLASGPRGDVLSGSEIRLMDKDGKPRIVMSADSGDGTTSMSLRGAKGNRVEFILDADGAIQFWVDRGGKHPEYSVSVGAKGHVRVVLGATEKGNAIIGSWPDGTSFLELLDAKGRMRGTVAVDASGDSRLRMLNAEGGTTAEVPGR